MSSGVLELRVVAVFERHLAARLVRKVVRGVYLRITAKDQHHQVEEAERVCSPNFWLQVICARSSLGATQTRIRLRYQIISEIASPPESVRAASPGLR